MRQLFFLVVPGAALLRHMMILFVPESSILPKAYIAVRAAPAITF
jgi:hypothetical protein